MSNKVRYEVEATIPDGVGMMVSMAIRCCVPTRMAHWLRNDDAGATYAWPAGYYEETTAIAERLRAQCADVKNIRIVKVTTFEERETAEER